MPLSSDVPSLASTVEVRFNIHTQNTTSSTRPTATTPQHSISDFNPRNSLIPQVFASSNTYHYSPNQSMYTNWSFFDQDQEFAAMTADNSSPDESPTDSGGTPNPTSDAPATSSESTNAPAPAATDHSPPPDSAAATAAAIVAATTTGLAADTGNPSSSDDQSQTASFASSQRTNLIANTTIRAPLEPIQEDQDSTTSIVGVSFSVSNKSLDIHDLLLYFLDTIKAPVIYDYKKRRSSQISKQQLMHMMSTPAEATKLYNNFFGVQDDIPRDKHDTWHRLLLLFHPKARPKEVSFPIRTLSKRAE